MTETVPWWKLLHQWMTALQLPAADFKRMTIPQLLCLMHETPPGKAGKVTSLGDWERIMAARKAEEERWSRPAG